MGQGQIVIHRYGACGKDMARHLSLRAFLCLVLLVVGLAVAGALPALAQNAQRVPVEKATTEQKAVFVGKLVGRSVAAKTIEDKGDSKAKASLARARSLVEEARRDIADARYSVANGKLDEALRLVNTEARKLSEADIKGKRQQEAYDKRHNAVAIFLSAYERVASDKELSAATKAHIKEIRTAMRQAEGLAAAGDMTKAINVLESAYRTARGDIRQLREGETLVRTLNFETPEEEYLYEHDRNDSHIMLLRFAISEKNPPATRRVRIDALHEQAMDLRSEAEAEARSGDHVDAIETLVQSTQTLLKAIRMSGVWIPG